MILYQITGGFITFLLSYLKNVYVVENKQSDYSEYSLHLVTWWDL